jgi:regulator of replication initiation timing
MKTFVRRLSFWVLLGAAPFLAGCSKQLEQIANLKENLNVTREANTAGTIELQELNQKLSMLNQQVRGQHGKRMEFEAKAQKSGEAEKLLVKYRTELETSLKAFADSVTAYRQQYLTP